VGEVAATASDISESGAPGQASKLTLSNRKEPAVKEIPIQMTGRFSSPE